LLLHPKTSITDIVPLLIWRNKAVAMIVIAGETGIAEYDIIVFFDLWVETYLTVVVARQSIPSLA
jgi:hypothetical protein